MNHVHLGLVLLSLLAVTACRDVPVTCGVPDSKQECECSDGRTGGSQTCRNEAWTACVCPGEPIVGSDASTDGQVEASIDSGADTDSGADDGG